MRCARCDRLAIPQAVGLSPEGLVVFGWCLDCLHEAGCTDVEAVARPRFRPRRRPPPTLRLAPVEPPGAGPCTQRLRHLLLVAGFLGCWSIVLMAAGVLTSQRPPAPPSPLGNGTSMLFLAGGAATAATAMLLLALSLGRALLASHRAFGWLQTGAFLLALTILTAGIVFHDPRRDPFIVAAAGLALALSIGANWRQRRIPLPPHAGPFKNQQVPRST